MKSKMSNVLKANKLLKTVTVGDKVLMFSVDKNTRRLTSIMNAKIIKFRRETRSEIHERGSPKTIRKKGSFQEIQPEIKTVENRQKKHLTVLTGRLYTTKKPYRMAKQ